jgi:5'-3' exonuclease
MDWLLSSPSEDPKAVSKKPGSALETLMKNLGSRQARRPGYGVRLFVQACVLAGCDYAPNKLSGIGLVGAFKLIRDTAFRNDGVRFTKALDSLPGKTKQGLDIKEYELILAKNEAVFYNHLVRHLDGSNRPLSEPLRSYKFFKWWRPSFFGPLSFHEMLWWWLVLLRTNARMRAKEGCTRGWNHYPIEPGKKQSQMKPQPSTKPPKPSKVERVEINKVENPYRRKKRPREDLCVRLVKIISHLSNPRQIPLHD